MSPRHTPHTPDAGAAPAATSSTSVEAEIARWRSYVVARSSVTAADADELEDHLRGQIDDLTAAGLAQDEAFLVAIKRMGSQADVAREFARTHSRRLWRQLVLDGGESRPRGTAGPMLGFAVAAGLAVKLPWLAIDPERAPFDYLLTAMPLLLTVLAAFLWWRRSDSAATLATVGSVAAGLIALGVAYPFDDSSDTATLALLHGAIVMWLGVGIAYAAGDWRSRNARMDFIRFTGEWLIYMFLIATGGGVLMGVSLAVFEGLGLDPIVAITEWVLPLGVGGATVVAAWLVESKQEVLESIAPALTRIFAPVATLALVAMLGGAAVSGGFQDSRDVLIAVDLVLVVVLGLVLYSISAIEPSSPAGWTDRLQLALVVAALALDVVALVAMADRTFDGGLTPNRVATLGMNLVLLVNLTGTAWLYLQRLLRGTALTALLRWQTGYLPVFGAWAAVVVVALPPLFAFA
ncbi:permease prefix domain 1-containing protein [Demequina sp. NBRC 110052]|uniref:permease prefix domain 1-containing protein n=1 Tax=Demequina sp. NBRC 110052 TaxID=1570341 RepID=UPI001F3B9534|nr:permease prefix domain 1-containing protein [Demequina sp. NBRC 110052]